MRVEDIIEIPKETKSGPDLELVQFAKDNLKREHGEISKELIRAGLASGGTLAAAGRFAGSLAKNPGAPVANILKREPELREEITNILEEKIDMLLENLKEKEVIGRGCGEITVSVERLTKVKNLVEGKSTENLAVKVMGFKDSYAIGKDV